MGVTVAPQAGAPGWREADLLRLRETWDDLRQRVTFDPARVLLAGFSAGGAMTFHRPHYSYYRSKEQL